jgi:PQQ-dependent dehydrogenase (s-GDH family)
MTMRLLIASLSLLSWQAIAAQCTGTNAINFQRWNNVTGTTIASLTSNANYPNNPNTSGTLTIFEIAANTGDNYGVRVYGFICPPTTGNYRFWIAGDDNCELRLSNSSNPANKVRIAYHNSWTNSREWNKFSTQRSSAINLTAGQLYFVEALMKEGGGGDNMAVGWSRPGQSTTAPSEVIPATRLRTGVADVQAPTVPTNLAAANIGQSSFLLTWSASSDNIGVAGYDVFRNGTKINTTNISGTSYTVTGLTPGTTNSFTVLAKDAAGNSSAQSAAINVTTLLPAPGTETFTMRTVLANQRMPHDLVYGSDGNLWFIERFGGTVSFTNPNNLSANKTTVLTLGSAMARTDGQDGLFGLALHPDFINGKPFVYIAYTYESTSATLRKTKIERYTYNSTTQQLGSPITIQDNIPGSNDHNSGRLEIGPDGKLYYSVGDMGAGQFANATRANNAQDLNILEGKILRYNTELINNSWIPADNPFTNGGQPTPIYTFGHRNPQGLVWGNVAGTNILYSTEHGPFSDDEVNIVEAGRNYGWPNVIGFCDGNYNGRTTGGFALVNEQTNCTALNAKEPIRSMFPANPPPNETTSYLTWPSVAPSGTTFYGSTAIPGWQNSLLIAQLKKGAVCRFKLSSNGLSIISDTIHYFKGMGRFRDVVVSPNGLKIYVACDSSGQTSGPTGGTLNSPPNPGSILEFTYQAPTNRLAAPKETIVGSEQPSVYPNPANNYVVVATKQVQGVAEVDILDMNGQLLKQQRVGSATTVISTQDLKNGVYLLKLLDAQGNTIGVKKLMIQR